MTNLNKYCLCTPPTNRGVLCTSKKDLFLLFDWVQATFYPDILDNDIYKVFFYLFGIDSSQVLFNQKSAFFGYNICYSFRDICIFCSDREDMGFHLYLTGSACRNFEDLGLSYTSLFSKLLKLNVHYTRIDVSFDDFTGKYFNFNGIKKCIKDRSIISRFRTSTEFTKTNLINIDNIGYTIWFGTRSSDIQYVFYDKLKERIYNANCDIIDDNIKSWIRFEMRYRNNYADTIILNFLYNSDFNSYLLSLINNYISFRVKNISDKNRRRWKMCSWWSLFIGSVGKVKFQPKGVETSIVQKKNWLLRSCSYTAFEVFISDIPDLSSDSVLSSFLYSFLTNKCSDISDYDLQKINEYRSKNSLIPLSKLDVEDFIKNIKDVIIAKNEK